MTVCNIARSVEYFIVDTILLQQKYFCNFKNLEHLTDSCKMKLFNGKVKLVSVDDSKAHLETLVKSLIFKSPVCLDLQDTFMNH